MANDSNSSRRQLLKSLGAAGIWAGTLPLISACRNSKDNGQQSLHRNRPTVLSLFGTGTLDIGSKWQKAIDDINVEVLFTDNNNDTGPVITKMVSGTAATEYDIGGLQGGAERELARAGAIIPWDMTKIPNWHKNTWSFAKDIPYTKHDNKQYGIPTVINADSMIYRTDLISKVDSYAAVFDPALKGKTAMEDAWINSVIFAAIFLKENGLMQIESPGDLSEDELEGVMEFLIQKKKEGQFRTFWNGWEQGLSLIKTGEVHVMTGWEPIMIQAKSDGIPVAYAVPKEGYEGWSNDLLLHKGAAERGVVDAAHKFVDWELSGFYGCELRKQRGYIVPSDLNVEYAEEHKDQCDPDEQKNAEAHVLEKFNAMKGRTYWQNVRPQNFLKYEEWWSKLRSA